MKTNRILGIVASVLVLLQVLLVFVSWLVNAAAPDYPVRSLLSSEGIRWFCRTFVSNIGSPVLVWMLLLSIAYSVFARSGITGRTKGKENGSAAFPMSQPYLFQRRHALRIVFAELVIMLLVMFLLVAVPHATLLNVAGGLFPSSFSNGIIPFVAFTSIVCSITYGVVCGTLRGIGDVYEAVADGACKLGKVVPVYILLVELIHSLMFVLTT